MVKNWQYIQGKFISSFPSDGLGFLSSWCFDLALGGYFMVWFFLLVLKARAEKKSGDRDDLFWWIWI